MGRRRVLSDSQVQHAVIAYRDGMTIDELAAQFGVSSSPVRRALLAAGVQLRPRPHRPLRLDVDDIVRRYQDGASMSMIALDLDVHVNTIKRRLVAAGVELRPRGRGEAGHPGF